jgi:hypothetical protein
LWLCGEQESKSSHKQNEVLHVFSPPHWGTTEWIIGDRVTIPLDCLVRLQSIQLHSKKTHSFSKKVTSSLKKRTFSPLFFPKREKEAKAYDVTFTRRHRANGIRDHVAGEINAKNGKGSGEKMDGKRSIELACRLFLVVWRFF